MLKFRSVNITASILFILLIILYIYFNISILWLLLLGITWLVITMFGSGLIGWNYHINAINANPKIAHNYVAITFDDGPNSKYTPKVLELLQKHKAKATFFCVGKHIEAQPDIFKSIIEQGHTIGNHTFSHANSFGFFSTKKVLSELNETNSLVKKLTGKSLLLFRPAFGVTNPRIKRAVNQLNLQTVGWNKRSLDTTKLTEKQILARITKNLKKGDVILLHDTSNKSIAVLEQLLLFLHQNNLQSVTVNDLFNVKAYA